MTSFGSAIVSNFFPLSNISIGESDGVDFLLLVDWFITVVLNDEWLRLRIRFLPTKLQIALKLRGEGEADGFPEESLRATCAGEEPFLLLILHRTAYVCLNG